MITLKLSVYTEKESKTLATLLSNNRYHIQHDLSNHCNKDCYNCDYRHLCIDLSQAEMYAKDYIPKR